MEIEKASKDRFQEIYNRYNEIKEILSNTPNFSNLEKNITFKLVPIISIIERNNINEIINIKNEYKNISLLLNENSIEEELIKNIYQDILKVFELNQYLNIIKEKCILIKSQYEDEKKKTNKIEYKNNFTYYGEIKDNKIKNGYGLMESNDLNVKLIGVFIDDEFKEGIIMNNSFIYKGEFVLKKEFNNSTKQLKDNSMLIQIEQFNGMKIFYENNKIKSVYFGKINDNKLEKGLYIKDFDNKNDKKANFINLFIYQKNDKNDIYISLNKNDESNIRKINKIVLHKNEKTIYFKPSEYYIEKINSRINLYFYKEKQNNTFLIGKNFNASDLNLIKCIVLYDNGDLYFGGIKDEKKEGDGIYYSSVQNLIYKGFIEKDTFRSTESVLEIVDLKNNLKFKGQFYLNFENNNSGDITFKEGLFKTNKGNYEGKFNDNNKRSGENNQFNFTNGGKIEKSNWKNGIIEEGIYCNHKFIYNKNEKKIEIS